MHLKKYLGQHILVAEPTVEKIVRTLNPTKEDTILEIGPGTGKLTKHLLKSAGSVIAIEKDQEMISNLKSQISDLENLRIIHDDFLNINLESLLLSMQSCGRTSALFAGNLPYNISTPILFKLKENKKLFRRGIVMVQKEVAVRLTAKPGGKDYGVLSIMMQSAAVMKKCFDVSPKSFVPPPKVTSSVVLIEFPEKLPYLIENTDVFERIVKSAFQQRRKMIRNSIPKEYLPALKAANIDPMRRPETLTIDEFAKLSALIKA